MPLNDYNVEKAHEISLSFDVLWYYHSNTNTVSFTLTVEFELDR